MTALMMAVLRWYTFAPGMGKLMRLPKYGTSNNGGKIGNFDRGRCSMAEKEETSNSFRESTRTLVVVSCVATRERLSSAFLSAVKKVGLPASSAVIFTSSSAEDAPAR